MKKKYIITEIANLLDAINEQSEIIGSYEQNIPQIELDIIKANTSKLYEAIIQLNKINQTVEKPSQVETPPVEMRPVETTQVETSPLETPLIETPLVETFPVEMPPIETKPIVLETIPEEEALPFDEDISEPIKFIIENPVMEEPLKTQSETIKITPEIPEKPVQKTITPSVDLFSDSQTMSDKYKTEAPSVNDKIAQNKSESTLSGKMNSTPIGDLKMAIGINQKFRFVNELFEGNLAEYNNTIDTLNNAQNLAAAHLIIDQLKEKYKWNSNSDAFNEISELILRRHS